jgi:SagB-type dehydrogenase family enzyme
MESRFMTNLVFIAILTLVFTTGALWAAPALAKTIKLPAPAKQGSVSLEQALTQRRTHRSFQAKPISLEQLSQLLWAAYGVTGSKYGIALKTAPSAGATYPLDIYVVVGKEAVKKLEPGVYRFIPKGHSLEHLKSGDRRRAAASAALGQMWAAEAPVMFIIAAQYERCTAKYGQRGKTYTHIEAGCVGQNIFLQAEALGLKAGIVGAFDDDALARNLGIPADQPPLLLMPVGHPD